MVERMPRAGNADARVRAVSGRARHVAVVGAGAAGLTAAIRAGEAGARVTLLNAHPKVGLKILMSGGTRCNVTHREVSERDFNAGSSAFVRRVLRAFSVEQTLAWFASSCADAVAGLPSAIPVALPRNTNAAPAAAS